MEGLNWCFVEQNDHQGRLLADLEFIESITWAVVGYRGSIKIIGGNFEETTATLGLGCKLVE